MPIPEQRDATAAHAALTQWLGNRLGASEVKISPFSGPSFSGFSNETIMFDASWTVGGRRQSQGMVVRVEPLAHRIFPDTEFEAQWLVQNELARASSVRLPPLLFFEEDTSVLGARFMVLGKVEGRVPTDSPPYHLGGWMHDELSSSERERLWWTGVAAMAKIHNAEVAPLRLPDLRRGTRAELDYYASFLASTLEGRLHPLAERAQRWMADNLPVEPEPAVCWGDARIGNMMFGDTFEVVAIFDWEQVLVGDPLMDLAWFLFLDRHHSEGLSVQRLPGLPDRDATVARWSELTGRSTEALGFYDVLAAYRLAVILLRYSDLIVGLGEGPRSEAGHGVDGTSCRLLEGLLSERGA